MGPARLPLIHCIEITLPLKALSPILLPPYSCLLLKHCPHQTAQAGTVFRSFSYKHDFNKNPSRTEISGPPTLHLFLCSHQYMLFQLCLKGGISEPCLFIYLSNNISSQGALCSVLSNLTILHEADNQSPFSPPGSPYSFHLVSW